jgi:Protein of unknown function (DUF2510)
MDLPPSGWYPDPYGTPSLLRWWDGSGWTQHTHPDVTAGAGGGGADPAATALQATAVQGAAVQETAVQSPVAAGPGVQATAVQPAATAVHAATVQAGAGPSADWLSRTKPPTGRPTAPQPALPAYPGADVGLAPTAYQPPVSTVFPGQTGPAGGGYAAAGQPTMVVQPGYPQPGTTPPGGGQGGGGDGTQVLFLGGDAWQAPGGPAQGNPYGYVEAQRRRRRRVIIGLSGGTAVAVAAIVIIATSLSSSPSTPVADQTTAAPAPSPTVAASTPAQTASPTASPSATTTATGSLLTDGQAGLSYTQLSAPWQGASCPSSLNNGSFPWTAGEYAVAGQINGGSNTWYGEACSGLLPQQYGYGGTSNLQTTTENLAQNFSNAYYGELDHNINQEQDQPLQVSGHAGWEVTYDVSYTDASDQGATWTDEQAAVVVVDNGTDQPAVFFTSIPQNLNEDNINALVSSLQLTSGSGNADQQGTATPTDTSQDGGNGN